MPMFDQTGPRGRGPLTGRGMGPCGRGRGFGRGLGRYFGWNTPQTKEDKKAEMEEYLKALKEEIEDTEKELAELSKNG